LLFLGAIVLGIVAGLLVGGRIGNLARLRFRWPWVIAIVVVVREVVLLTPLNRIEGAQYAYLLSLIAFVAWTIWNFNRLPAIWLITAGSALNLLVIAANAGRMPVAPEIAGPLLRRGSIGQYTVMGPGTNLNFLGDWITLYPVPEAYSLGDVLIALGLAIALFISTATPARIVS